MRIIRYTYNDGTEIAFCLDDVVTFETHDETDTLITLRNTRQINLDVEVEDFVAGVFSDIAEEKEYQLIEMESKRPLPVDFGPGGIGAGAA